MRILDQDLGYVLFFNHTTERQRRDTQQAMYLYEVVVCNLLATHQIFP